MGIICTCVRDVLHTYVIYYICTYVMYLRYILHPQVHYIVHTYLRMYVCVVYALPVHMPACTWYYCSVDLPQVHHGAGGDDKV